MFTFVDRMGAMESLGGAIKYYRNLRGYSLGKLEQKSGVSKAYIQKLESGARGKRPGLDIIQKLATGLGVTVDELRNWQPDPGLEWLKSIWDELPPHVQERIKTEARNGLSDTGRESSSDGLGDTNAVA